MKYIVPSLSKMQLPKERIIYATEVELSFPSAIKFKKGGIVNPDGSINWDCPCLGGVPQSVCGEDFKAALLCLLKSETKPAGGECITEFQKISKCLEEHPELIPDNDEKKH